MYEESLITKFIPDSSALYRLEIILCSGCLKGTKGLKGLSPLYTARSWIFRCGMKALRMFWFGIGTFKFSIFNLCVWERERKRKMERDRDCIQLSGFPTSLTHPSNLCTGQEQHYPGTPDTVHSQAHHRLTLSECGGRLFLHSDINLTAELLPASLHSFLHLKVSPY